jgi:hypothetical protein
MEAELKAGPSPRVAQRYHSTRTAALYLGLSPRTLEKWRLLGQGPSYVKRGRRCLYRLEDLDAWAEEGRTRSTSSGG